MEASFSPRMKEVGSTKTIFRQDWFYAIALLALIPVVQSFLTWSWNGKVTFHQAFIQILSVTAIVCEMAILRIASAKGFIWQNYFQAATRPLKIILILWLIIMALSVFTDRENILVSAAITLRYPLHILAFCSLIYLAKNAAATHAQEFYKTWYATICAAGAAYLSLLIIFSLSVTMRPEFPWSSGLPSATSVRHIANYLALFAIAFVSISLFASKQQKWVFNLGFFALVTFIAWTGARASILGMGASIFVGYLIMRKRVKFSDIRNIFGIFVAGIVASIAIPSPHPSFGMIRFWSKTGAKEDVSSGRIEIWLNTLSSIWEQPLLGHGAGRFGANMSRLYGYDLDNPHNFILQYFYDWGLVGGLMAMLMLGWLGWLIFQRRKAVPIAVFSAASGYSMLVLIGLLEGMLYHPIKIVLAMALIAPIFCVSRTGSESIRKKAVQTQ